VTKIDPAKVRARLDDVVRAMKDGGAWEVERPAPEAFVDMGAFGTRTMALEQWLRWVFVPNVETLLAQDGPWPGESNVGTHATREADGNERLDGVVTALREFDALFEEPPSVDPAVPNALNLAGWELLSSEDPSDTERAIAYFREALRVHPDVPAPLPNLGRALLKLGRDDEAIRTMEAAIGNSALNARAHNWLCWYFTTRREDLPRAIAHGRKAVEWGHAWGVTHMNLALALTRSGNVDEAYAYYGVAASCEGDHDVAYANEVRARFEIPRGQVRHALTSWRRAIAASREPARTEAYRAEHANLETALRAHPLWFPSERAELRWQKRPPDRDPPIRETLPAQAEAALALVPSTGGFEVLRRALEIVAESARNDTMPVALIGCDWGLDVEAVLVGLGPEASAAVARIERSWDRFLRAVWDLATEAEAPIADSELFAWERRLLVAGRFGDAIAALTRAALPSYKAAAAAAHVAERGAVRARVHGTRAQAVALLECAHGAQMVCARQDATGRDGPDAYWGADQTAERIAAWRVEA